ncbi:MutS protein msh4 [Tulasnella sp. 403]|nr:MutS protein msh4 [Tulasnella sp. 403]
MLNLRSVIRSLPTLRNALHGCQTNLLRVIHDMLSDARIEKIDLLISDALNEDVSFAKASSTLASVNERAYAVRANYDRLLDVARETYKENVGDIMELVNNLSKEHDLPLSTVFQEKDGFWLTLRKDELDGKLPNGFVNVTSKGAKWKFMTMELVRMHFIRGDKLIPPLWRTEETKLEDEGFIGRNTAYERSELVADIIEDIGVLYKASEAVSERSKPPVESRADSPRNAQVALLDMLWSFAHVAILYSYTRPEFTGTLAVKGGRHPVVEKALSIGAFVPNDTYICDASTFQIIHGPNMSGKSTYLRQVGVMTVMAMCGSFVPAEYASFRVHDALLSRLSNDDDPEKSLSTFATEMAASAMILSLATDRSLILIDELGRGTSPIEGVGIAHAIAEELIDRKILPLQSFVLFSTHYADLSTTLSKYPSVVK